MENSAIHSTDGGETELTCENFELKETATRRCVNCCIFCDFCATPAHQRSLETKDHRLRTLHDQHKQLFEKTEEVRANITKRKIEAVLKSVHMMKEKVENTSKATEKDVDDFIDKHIKALEEKRIALKQKTKKITATKMKELEAQENGLKKDLTGLKTLMIYLKEKKLTNVGNSDVLSLSKQLTSRWSQLSEKPFAEHQCQYDKIWFQFNENLIRDFIHGANVIDASTVDCSVAQRINGHLVENQGRIHDTQGQLLEFVVQIKNPLGENLKSMADKIKANVNDPHGIKFALHIKSLTDGTYSFNVPYQYRSDFHVMVDGKSILGSPIHKQAQRNMRPAIGLHDYDIYEQDEY